MVDSGDAPHVSQTARRQTHTSMHEQLALHHGYQALFVLGQEWMASL